MHSCTTLLPLISLFQHCLLFLSTPALLFETAVLVPAVPQLLSGPGCTETPSICAGLPSLPLDQPSLTITHLHGAQEKKQLVFEGTVGRDAEALGRLTEDDLRFLFG